MSHPLNMQFASLQESLLSNNPTMPTLLREIHTKLMNDPDVVTLVTEAEIKLVVSGLSKLTAVKFAESLSKSTKVSKSLKNANLDIL